MTDERTRLLARLRRHLDEGVGPSGLSRRMRLRRVQRDALTDEARAAAPASPDAPPLPPWCGCENTGTLGSAYLEAAERYARMRPPARWQVDQCHITPGDMSRRVALLAELDDLDGKDILFVGDDDFCSPLVFAAGRPRSVVVIDNDERILANVTRVAEEQGLPLRAVSFDLRRFVDEEGALPAELERAFDVFITDPPYSESGMLLFCAVGMTALRESPGGVGYVAVPWLNREEWSDELLFKVQRAFVQQGFVLTDVKRAFAAYEYEEEVFSTMLRAEAFLATRSPRDLLASWHAEKLYAGRRWKEDEAG